MKPVRATLLAAGLSIINIIAVSAAALGAGEEQMVGARPLGMGGAFVAVADDANAAYWNPAGLPSVQGNGITTMYSRNFGNDGIKMFYGALGLQSSHKIGFGLAFLSQSTVLEEEDPQGKVTGNKMGEYTLLPSLAYSPFTALSFGLGGRLVSLSTTTGVNPFWNGLDASVMLRAGSFAALGIKATNVVSTKVDNEALPASYKVGASIKVLSRLTLAGDIELKKDPADEAKNLTTPCYGLEFKVFDPLSLRAGMKNGRFTGGIGLGKERFRIDYAYDDNELGGIHRVSLSMLAGGL